MSSTHSYQDRLICENHEELHVCSDCSCSSMFSAVATIAVCTRKVFVNILPITDFFVDYLDDFFDTLDLFQSCFNSVSFGIKVDSILLFTFILQIVYCAQYRARTRFSQQHHPICYELLSVAVTFAFGSSPQLFKCAIIIEVIVCYWDHCSTACSHTLHLFCNIKLSI